MLYTSYLKFLIWFLFVFFLFQLMSLILEHFVYSWYKDISVNDQFVDDVRHVIRFASTSFGYRLSKV